MANALPPDITQGATLRGNEYGWIVSTFPSAVAKAEVRGYACLGGQFQFRLEDGSTCEMYWLEADSAERTVNLGRIIVVVLAQRFCKDFSV